jgi:glycosyltransferase involved in cell wall biosynthesis
VLEALAAGVPVIGSDVAGVRELLDKDDEHRACGLVVPRSDVRAAASALARLLEDGELRTALGAAGRARVTDRHDHTAQAQRFVDVVRRSLGAQV